MWEIRGFERFRDRVVWTAKGMEKKFRFKKVVTVILRGVFG